MVVVLVAGDSFPTGGIILWSGAANAIPTGWVLCDGQNSTPDLRNRFVVGAGDSYAVDATGGSADATLVSHTHGSGNLGTGNAGSHSHSGNTNNTGDHSQVVIQTIQVLTNTDGVLMIVMEHHMLETLMLMVVNPGSKLGLMNKVLTLTILIPIILDHTHTI